MRCADGWPTGFGAVQRQAVLRLGLRNLYILPTGFGGLWLAGATLLQVVAIQTQRNGPLLLSFLMLGLMLLALLLTHFNLQGLELRSGAPAAGFADATLHYPLLLQSHIPRQAIRLRFSGSAAPTGAGAGAAATATAGTTLDQLVPGQTRLTLAWRCPQRGRQLPGTLVIESTAPLGLFLCWSRWRPAAPQTVYPARISGPAGLPRELALCHLSAEIWRRSRSGEAYGLRLGAVEIPPGRGRAQRDRCLLALACHG